MSIVETLRQSPSSRGWGKISRDAIWLLQGSLGTKIYRKKLTQNLEGKYLNLGCGGSKFKDWINADYYKLHRIFRGLDSWPDWMLDATQTWNCPDNFFGGIYSEHTIEHIYYDQAISVFQECYRTLQPGKHLRIVVPDLQKFVQYYNGESPHHNFSDFPCGAKAISSLTQNWGHVSVWDRYLLIQVLKEIGFKQVQQLDYQQGNDPELLKDSLKRQWSSLYVEAQKPVI